MKHLFSDMGSRQHRAVILERKGAKKLLITEQFDVYLMSKENIKHLLRNSSHEFP